MKSSVLVIDLNSNGNEFHSFGPWIVNDLSANVFLFTSGTNNFLVSDSDCRPSHLHSTADKSSCK